ncbi:hypothetical protein LTR10_008105 [Elasticomyces elasticus]|nr:hypothetical protein LTR10_008105 [Elasticomyces elasticus]KAK4971102.1 hypothetical protein LTR42_008081 [Elasticomyces elasticus]
MAARSKALALPELLEIILFYLPTKDLLFAQKVSKHWLTTITTSPSLQKALFFLPGTKNDLHLEPTLKRANPPVPWKSPVTTLDPLLLNVGPSTTFPMFGAPLRADILSQGLHAEASCRRMYLMQPPAAAAVYIDVEGFEKAKLRKAENTEPQSTGKEDEDEVKEPEEAKSEDKKGPNSEVEQARQSDDEDGYDDEDEDGYDDMVTKKVYVSRQDTFAVIVDCFLETADTRELCKACVTGSSIDLCVEKTCGCPSGWQHWKIKTSYLAIRTSDVAIAERSLTTCTFNVGLDK